MVEALIFSSVDRVRVRTSPLIIEIVGLAGAGKSSVLSTLRDRGFDIVYIDAFRQKTNVPFYIASSLSLLPTLVCEWARGTPCSLREMNWMIRLHAMRHILQRQTSRGGATVVLDQGPIHTLVKLRYYDAEISRGPCYSRWRARIIEQWATSLDAIIWLDAPEDILIERIRARKKWHSLKEKSEREAKELLTRSRVIYKEVVSDILAHGALTLLSFDTSEQAPPRIVGGILASLGLVEEQIE